MPSRITQEQFNEMLASLIKSPKIREVYDVYIIKEIPYEEWVESNARRLLEDNDYEIEED